MPKSLNHFWPPNSPVSDLLLQHFNSPVCGGSDWFVTYLIARNSINGGRVAHAQRVGEAIGLHDDRDRQIGVT
jgi:hypothetical protein